MNSGETQRLLRTLALLSVTAAITAGALCTGMGTGSSTPARVDTQTSSGYGWKVVNLTDKPLTQVDFTKSNHYGGHTSGPSNVKAAVLASGANADGYLADTSPIGSVDTSGSLCYDGTRWDLPEQNTPYIKWRGVYIFATDNGHGGKQLFATPEGAHDDRGMVYHGACSPA